MTNEEIIEEFNRTCEGVVLGVDAEISLCNQEAIRDFIAEKLTLKDQQAQEAEAQINKLANFIMAEIDGEPSESEGAVDCAIRIMKAFKSL